MDIIVNSYPLLIADVISFLLTVFVLWLIVRLVRWGIKKNAE
ncbi:large-conductance mechanosensitive channel [Pedobacter sp. UYP1]|jgi:large-conductance mechanosensitive channel